MTCWDKPNIRDILTAEYWKNPFTCDDCSAILAYKSPNYSYQKDKQSRVMLSGCYKNTLCRNCLAKRIARWFATPLSGLERHFATGKTRGVCDCCAAQKYVATIMTESWLDIRFGSQWWNGHWMCRDCLVACVLHGHEQSTSCCRLNGKTYYENEAGALLGYIPFSS